MGIDQTKQQNSTFLDVKLYVYFGLTFFRCFSNLGIGNCKQECDFSSTGSNAISILLFQVSLLKHFITPILVKWMITKICQQIKHSNITLIHKHQKFLLKSALYRMNWISKQQLIFLLLRKKPFCTKHSLTLSIKVQFSENRKSERMRVVCVFVCARVCVCLETGCGCVWLASPLVKFFVRTVLLQNETQ